MGLSHLCQCWDLAIFSPYPAKLKASSHLKDLLWSLNMEKLCFNIHCVTFLHLPKIANKSEEKKKTKQKKILSSFKEHLKDDRYFTTRSPHFTCMKWKNGTLSYMKRFVMCWWEVLYTNQVFFMKFPLIRLSRTISYSTFD